jgi:hypothetical protein
MRYEAFVFPKLNISLNGRSVEQHGDEHNNSNNAEGHFLHDYIKYFEETAL